MKLFPVTFLALIIFSTFVFGKQPDVLWTRSYQGSGYGDDKANAITVDVSGNVYVAGYETLPAGDTAIWLRKYDTDGIELWTARYNDPAGNNDQAEGIAVDGSGNVYVAGTVNMAEGDWTTQKIWVRKYDSDGNVLWTDTPMHGWLHGISTDNSGNIYVCGAYYFPGQSNDILLSKYDPAGNCIWTKGHNGWADDIDFANAVATDDSGFIYVTGSVTTSSDRHEIWLGKYTSSGNLLWYQTYHGTAVGYNYYNEGRAVALDEAENIYLVGCEYDTQESGNIWLKKVNANGEGLWRQVYNSSGDGWDQGEGVAIDSSGNLFVCGSAQVAGESSNVWLRKYDSSGNPLWTMTYNGIDNSDDKSLSVAVDDSGHVYIAGYETVWGQGTNIWVRKYSSDTEEEDEDQNTNHIVLSPGQVRVQGGAAGYANPLKGEQVKIHFIAQQIGTVKVSIYTLNGQLVRENSKETDGNADYITWACENSKGSIVSSGVYIIHLEGPGINTTKKIAILR